MCYSIDVKRKKDKKLVDLYSFDDKHDLLVVFKNWMSELTEEPYSIGDKVVCLDTNNLFAVEQRSIVGQLSTGRTGTGSVIRTKEGEVKTEKQTTDIDEIKLFFMIHIPKPGKGGVIICQDHNGLNPFQCMRSFLRNKFQASFEDYSIIIKPIVFKEIIDSFLKEGQLIALELKRRMRDPEEIDKVSPDKNQFNYPFISHVYTPDPKVKHLKYSIVKDMSKIYEQEGGEKRYLNIEFEQANLTLSVGDKTRKINMEKVYSRANIWPLADDISLDKNRIPVYEEVKTEAFDLLKDILP